MIAAIDYDVTRILDGNLTVKTYNEWIMSSAAWQVMTELLDDDSESINSETAKICRFLLEGGQYGN